MMVAQLRSWRKYSDKKKKEKEEEREGLHSTPPFPNCSESGKLLKNVGR